MTMKLDDIKIKSKNAVDNKDLMNNMHRNIDLISDWVQPCWQHNHKALIVSAGRSLERHIPAIKKRQKEGYKIFCVKHSFPKLVKAGITPEAVLILDPRPIEGYSTHGVQRKDLYEEIPEDTLFFVASMTNTTVTEHLLSVGAKVIGWHPAVTGLVEVLQERKMNAIMIHDGTSSGTRGVGLLKMLGYRHIELIAFDSDVDEPSEQQKRERNVEGPNKYAQVVDDDGTVFWTTGELMAQVQDIRHIVKVYANSNIHLFMWEGGLGFRAFQKEAQTQAILRSGGGLGDNIHILNYDQHIKALREQRVYSMDILGSDGNKLQIKDQGVIRHVLAEMGFNWDAPPVVK